MMSYITSIGISNPEHSFTQQTIANFMVKAMRLDSENERKLHALYRATGIETRYSVLADYGKTSGFEFFSNAVSFEPFPTTRQRLDLYREHALKLSVNSISQCLNKFPSLKREEITHLVAVSCTGMYAPGLDIDLVTSLDLKKSIHRTCINFMGCYAAFNAVKLADAFCMADSKAKVLVVCTELCSIHFQKENSEDNLLANALFADGSAALLVEATPRPGMNLSPLSFHCDLATHGANDMAWKIGDHGFEMKLSTYVPEIIRSGIKQLMQSLLNKISIPFSEVDYFAIHPGGKKILEVIEQELTIQKTDNDFAYEVLKKHGNMSSPTVLFVLKKIYDQLVEADNRKKILSFAFGPGLTLESMLLQSEWH